MNQAEVDTEFRLLVREVEPLSKTQRVSAPRRLNVLTVVAILLLIEAGLVAALFV